MACAYAKGFSDEEVAEFRLKIEDYNSDLLNDVLKYELTKMSDTQGVKELEVLEKYGTHKLVNRFIIQENLKSLQPQSRRFPASTEALSEKIQKIQKRIDSL